MEEKNEHILGIKDLRKDYCEQKCFPDLPHRLLTWYLIQFYCFVSQSLCVLTQWEDEILDLE